MTENSTPTSRSYFHKFGFAYRHWLDHYMKSCFFLLSFADHHIITQQTPKRVFWYQHRVVQVVTFTVIVVSVVKIGRLAELLSFFLTTNQTATSPLWLYQYTESVVLIPNTMIRWWRESMVEYSNWSSHHFDDRNSTHTGCTNNERFTGYGITCLWIGSEVYVDTSVEYWWGSLFQSVSESHWRAATPSTQTSRRCFEVMARRAQ